MKIQFLETQQTYDGSQLQPLKNYLQHGLLGDSMVAWLGPCQVTPEHMIDGEDLRADEKICADEMAHFVLELFHCSLEAGILLQRLMAEMTLTIFQKMGLPSEILSRFERRGDDLYLESKKLNISIATVSSNSVLIHFAVNTKPTGAPVSISCLEELKLDKQEFTKQMLAAVQRELEDIRAASYKVRTF